MASHNIEQILDLFTHICRIPRASGSEGAVAKWLESFADKHGFGYIEVPVKAKQPPNVIIRVPATPDYADSPAICLQAHTDMVCQKTPQSNHNFETDPIIPIIEDGWIRADNTTLGADNGVGVAMAMAAALTDNHPPLELLFTVDEEGGLTGASALPGSQLEARLLINLDSEDDMFIIGCAGGQRFEITGTAMPVEIPQGSQCYEIAISGLLGGHSGVDIHKNRLNAIKVCGRLLESLKSRVGLLLCKIAGGSMTTAIARDIRFTICAPSDAAGDIMAAITEFESGIIAQDTEDKAVKISCSPVFDIPAACCAEDTAAIITLLYEINCGPQSYCKDFPHIVETSSSIGTIDFDAARGEFVLAGSERSSLNAGLNSMSLQNSGLAESLGFRYKEAGRYSPWQPNKNSKLLKICRKAYRKLNDREPKIEIVHAGLECGVIGTKYPDMDMISFGPLIENAHSPNERANIESIERSYELLLEIINTRVLRTPSLTDGKDYKIKL